MRHPHFTFDQRRQLVFEAVTLIISTVTGLALAMAALLALAA